MNGCAKQPFFFAQCKKFSLLHHENASLAGAWLGLRRRSCIMSRLRLSHLRCRRADGRDRQNVSGAGQVNLIFIYLIAGLLGAFVFTLWKLKSSGFWRDQDLETEAGVEVIQSGRWRDLSQLSRDLFVRRGYEVTLGNNQHDSQGVDFILSKPGDLRLALCKQWGEQELNEAPIQNLLSMLAAKGANGGIIVTTGKFSAAAYLFAQGRPIELIDGEKLWDQARFQLSADFQTRIQQQVASKKSFALKKSSLFGFYGAIFAAGLAILLIQNNLIPGRWMNALRLQSNQSETVSVSAQKITAEKTSIGKTETSNPVVPLSETNRLSSTEVSPAITEKNEVADALLEAVIAAEPSAEELEKLQADSVARVLLIEGITSATWSSNSTLSIIADKSKGIEREVIVTQTCAALKSDEALRRSRLQISMIDTTTASAAPVFFKQCLD